MLLLMVDHPAQSLPPLPGRCLALLRPVQVQVDCPAALERDLATHILLSGAKHAFQVRLTGLAGKRMDEKLPPRLTFLLLLLERVRRPPSCGCFFGFPLFVFNMPKFNRRCPFSPASAGRRGRGLARTHSFGLSRVSSLLHPSPVSFRQQDSFQNIIFPVFRCCVCMLTRG